MNKKIYLIGNGSKADSATTEYDITEKSINPMGGWANYGVITEDFVMVKGSTPGVRRRPLVIRESLVAQTSKSALEDIKLKLVDTTSDVGHGRFQTPSEKAKFCGTFKKELAAVDDE